LSKITTEYRWVIGSVVLTLGGIILGALLAEPRAFGITALANPIPWPLSPLAKSLKK
jgi:hypothetical protein